MAGNGLADWLFMPALMWPAAIRPERIPFLDNRLVYAPVPAGVYLADAGRYVGLGDRWANLALVQRYGLPR